MIEHEHSLPQLCHLPAVPGHRGAWTPWFFGLIALGLLSVPTACGEDDADGPNSYRDLWPGEWLLHDERALDPSFSAAIPVVENCGDACYWTGIQRCPDSDMTTPPDPWFEPGVVCDPIIPIRFGDFALLPNGRILVERGFLLEMTLDSTPGRVVEIAPASEPITGVYGDLVNFGIDEFEVTDDGRVFALGPAGYDAGGAIIAQYALMELDPVTFEYSLAFDLGQIVDSDAERFVNLSVSSAAGKAVMILDTIVPKTVVVDLDAGTFEIDPFPSHPYTTRSGITVDGMGYFVPPVFGTTDILVTEVSFEDGSTRDVPWMPGQVPWDPEQEWLTGDRTWRTSSGYFVRRQLGNGDGQHVLVQPDGAQRLVGGAFEGSTLVATQPPVMTRGRIYALASFVADTTNYTRSGLWFTDL